MIYGIEIILKAFLSRHWCPTQARAAFGNDKGLIYLQKSAAGVVLEPLAAPHVIRQHLDPLVPAYLLHLEDRCALRRGL